MPGILSHPHWIFNIFKSNLHHREKVRTRLNGIKCTPFSGFCDLVGGGGVFLSHNVITLYFQTYLRWKEIYISFYICANILNKHLKISKEDVLEFISLLVFTTSTPLSLQFVILLVLICLLVFIIVAVKLKHNENENDSSSKCLWHSRITTVERGLGSKRNLDILSKDVHFREMVFRWRLKWAKARLKRSDASSQQNVFPPPSEEICEQKDPKIQDRLKHRISF